MSLAAVWNIGPVTINNTKIPGIIQSGASNGVVMTNPVESGNLYPTFAAVTGCKQGIAFTARDVAAVLGVTGTTGAGISAATEAYFKKRGAVGPASGSVHRKYAATVGVIVPGTLSVGHQGNAQITASIVPVSSDGASSALTMTNTNALPSVSNQADVYTIYSAAVNGTDLAGLEGVDIDFGCNVRTVGSNSDLFDVVAGVVSVTPTVTLRGVDLQTFSTAVADTGTSLTQSTTTIILRKRGASTASLVHMKFTCYGVAYLEQLADGSSSESEATVAVRYGLCSSDGSAAPLIYTPSFNIT